MPINMAAELYQYNKKPRNVFSYATQPFRLLTLLFFLTLKTLLEAVNASAGINQLLLTGKEGMALGTNFHTNPLSCRFGFKAFAASTCHRSGFIARMYGIFHGFHLIRYNSPANRGSLRAFSAHKYCRKLRYLGIIPYLFSKIKHIYIKNVFILLWLVLKP